MATIPWETDELGMPIFQVWKPRLRGVEGIVQLSQDLHPPRPPQTLCHAGKTFYNTSVVVGWGGGARNAGGHFASANYSATTRPFYKEGRELGKLWMVLARQRMWTK